MNKDDWTNGPRENAPRESQLDALMKQLLIEKAPRRLTRRLRRIPREQRRRNSEWTWPFPNWAMAPAFAAVPLAALLVLLMQDRQPAPADVEQARQDLAVAFAYLDKAGYRTGQEIQTVLGSELRQTVKGNLSKHIPFTIQSFKEETI